MKKLFFVFALLLFCCSTVFAQVGINSDNSAPDPSAGLDVKFNNKGLLPPRMTHAQMISIENPANGLIIYCTDCSNSSTGALAMFISGAWYIFVPNCLLPLFPSTNIHTAAATQITWNWNPVSDATGYKWNTTTSYNSAIDLGSSTTKTETGLACNTIYTRYIWSYNICGNSSATTLTHTTLLDPPATPTTGTHLPLPTQIIWNWNTVPNATGYKWGTTNNYADATDMGAATTKTETGLTCSTAYTRYAWAYSACGNSTPVTLNQSTSLNPPATPVAGTQVPLLTQITWNWNTVPDATGYKWSAVDNYTGATDMGTATTRTETGLTCNTAYTRYAWAYSACGNSTPVTLTQTTSLNPPATPTAGTHVPAVAQITWNWNTVANATGYKWSIANNYGGATDMGTATTKTETGLTCSVAYTRYVWAYNACGNSTPVALNQTTSDCGVPCPGTPTVTYGGQTYNTVQIGSQCWFKENLNIGTRINGALEQTDNSTIEKYCYNDLESNCNIYGGLYQWAEMMQYVTTAGVKGICPTGWHIPTDGEWCTVTQFLDSTVNCGANGPSGTNAGGKMKSTGTVQAGTGLWNTINTGATNASGFTAFPAGDRDVSGTFWDFGFFGYGWSSSKNDAHDAWGRFVSGEHSDVTRCNSNEDNGFSVRCVRDTCSAPPNSPTSGTHNPTQTVIIWNWNTVNGATGYKWGLTNNFADATDMGTAITKTETGLTCNTAYTRYAWAYNGFGYGCGYSTATTLAQSTTMNPAVGVSIAVSANPVCSGASVTFTATPTNGGTSPAYQWKKNGEIVAGAINSTYSYIPVNSDSIKCQLTSSTACSQNSPATSNAITLTVNAVPASPTAGTHVPAMTQITWNWNTVANATGYKWNTTDDYTTATEMGTATTKSESVLTCSTNYIRFVWAYNVCGYSTSLSLSQSTLACWSCGVPYTINHLASGGVAPVDKMVTYGTVNNIPGELSKCWITRNLGAAQQATAVDDATEASAGWYWQFNRKQGYQYTTSRIPSTGWYNTEDNLSATWETAKDPCTIELGIGWRIPTNTEWTNINASGNWTNWNGPFSSALKLHAAGYLECYGGSVYVRGSDASYWSSTQSSSHYGWTLFCDWSDSIIAEDEKCFGHTVRCVRDY